MEQPPSTEKTGPQKGDVIDGKLEIEGIIAEGRTSTVVSAIDRGNGGRKVAVKIARGSDLESVERFKRAARGMAKLTSPYAVKVLSVGTTVDGAPCMTMEYLEGRTLAQKVMQSGPLPIDEARQWMLQVCQAVADAHAQKLLHRDLDAENLFLAMPPLGSGGEPSIRVLDFGLAPVWRLGKGDGRLRPGDVPGTSFAMAPELARGSDVDERVDVWGIGACLFRLLTNKYPYNARNLAELCTRILAERPPDVTKVRAEVTPGLAAVVKKCLEREPADRFKTIRDVIQALEETSDEAPHTPQVPTEKATLDQLRAIEEHRMTPMVFRAGRAGSHSPDPEAERTTDPGIPIPSSDADDFETQIHRKEDLLKEAAKELAASRPSAKPAKEPTTLEPSTAPRNAPPKTIPKEPTTAEPPTEPLKVRNLVAIPIGDASGDIGATTPQTMRIVPAFEAIANRLEPPKPKRSEPPPKKVSGSLPAPVLPPPAPLFAATAKQSLELVAEDGPSTQPLGRLSPFAELPKAPPPESAPPSDDPTIMPKLIGIGPVAAPLPKPTPERMNAETMPPAPLPKPSPEMMGAETVQGPSPQMPPLPQGARIDTLPRPSPAMMAAETMPRGTPAPGVIAPLPVFQASPRVLEIPPHTPGAGMPVMPTPTPAPLPSGPPAPMPSMEPPAFAEPAPPSEAAPAKSKLLIPLIFALGIAISIVAGLYLARVSMQSKPKPEPSGLVPGVVSASSSAAEPMPSPTESETAATSDMLATPEAPSASPSGSHRRHRHPVLPPSAAPSAPAAPIKSGNVYDPNLY